MKVLLVYRHNRRCIPHYHRRAFAQLGHRVTTVGPWDESEPFGSPGREPHVPLPWRWPRPQYHRREIDWALQAAGYPLSAAYDLRVLFDAGEHLRVLELGDPWVHWCLEGSGLAEWGNTPFKVTGMRHAIPEEWRDKALWLPGAADAEWHRPLGAEREYDLIQVAVPRAARAYVWGRLREQAPDLNMWFGQLWGSLYNSMYQRAKATFVCATQDFVTMRTYEAMGMGCLVFADRNLAMLESFTEFAEFVGYDSRESEFGEHVADAEWLAARTREVVAGKYLDIPQRASAKIHAAHTYAHRVARLLEWMEQGR